MNTKVYRYEHLDKGFGPLCGDGLTLLGGRCWDELFDHHDSVDYFEEEYNKIEGGIKEKHYFGMTSKEALFSLTFSWTFRALEEAGFALFVYESEDAVVFPDGQVVFTKEKSKLLDIISLEEYVVELQF